MKVVSYEDIKKANDTINTTNIKGKEYAEVNQRIKAFRMLYPTGTISTELISDENGICIFKAIVGFLENGIFVTLGMGTAYEKENSSFINKTSYIENCETSAVGRALGMAGFGIDTSVASAEEVTNAINNQNKQLDENVQSECQLNSKVTDVEAKSIYNLMIRKGLNVVEQLQNNYGIDNTNKLTKEQYFSILKVVQAMPDKE